MKGDPAPPPLPGIPHGHSKQTQKQPHFRPFGISGRGFIPAGTEQKITGLKLFPALASAWNHCQEHRDGQSTLGDLLLFQGIPGKLHPAPPHLTERVKSPGLLLLGRARKLPWTPLVRRSFSASIPLMLGWNHLENAKGTREMRDSCRHGALPGPSPPAGQQDVGKREMEREMQKWRGKCRNRGWTGWFPSKSWV